MKQRYLLLSMILLVFLISTTSLSVFAVTPNLELTPAFQSVSVGSQVTIDVVVEDVTDLRGASIILNFAASNLQYASSDDGDFIPNDTLQVKSIDNTNGSVTLDIAGLGESGYHSGTGTGTIITVVFDTVDAGDTNITFGVTQLRDKNNNEIIHTQGNGCLISISIPHIELTPEIQGLDQGSPAAISVEIEDAVNLQGASITLNFDPAQLQYVSSADGGFIPDADLMEGNIDNTNGTVTLDIAGLGATAYASGNGTIMTINFDTIKAGNSIVTFGTTILRNKDNDEIIHTTGNGSIVTIDPPSLNFSPITQSVLQGSPATVNVNVEDAIDLRGANIILNFDPAQLQYVSSADGGFIPDASLMEGNIDNTNGIVTLDIAGLGTTAYASGNGTLFSVVFDRISTATTNVCFVSTNLRDKNNIPIYHSTGDCCIITSLLGDFGSANNGPPDCKVDFEDLMIFAMAYGATPSDDNWNPVCDIAGPSGSLVPDELIDFEDLMIFAMNYGKTCADL